MDMIASDESPSEVSNRIKEILFSKSAEKINEVRPHVFASSFDGQEYEEEGEE